MLKSLAGVLGGGRLPSMGRRISSLEYWETTYAWGDDGLPGVYPVGVTVPDILLFVLVEI